MPVRRLRTLLSAAALAAVASTTTAADIRINDSGILLEGQIRRGDYHSLRLELAKEPNTLRILRGLTLNSPGGDMGEAMKLAELIRLLRLQTKVAEGGICASACFFVWLGGGSRQAGFEGFTQIGRVGLHRPYLQSPSNTAERLQRQVEVQRITVQELERLLVPRRLVDILMSRPSNDIYWLTFEDIEELGEHPAELEELYIEKCGYDRRNLARLVVARRSGDGALQVQLRDRIGKASRCMAQLDDNAREEGLARLAYSPSWFPRDPFRVQPPGKR